jgi:hypothetical protein
MSIRNRNNINTLTINALGSSDTQGNVSINYTIKIPQTSETTNNVPDNANACIYLKDVNSIANNGSGDFYPLKVDSLEYGSPYLYFNSNLVIDSSNLLSELETILIDYPLDLSNIIITGGYINFFNGTIPNTNQGPTGVGLRYSSNNTVQFKNYNTDWIDLVDITTHDEFRELVDVDVYTNPLQNNQYIIYDAGSNLFINSNLAINNDPNPTLSNDLIIGTNSLVYSSNTSNILFDNTSTRNTLLSVVNNTTTTGISNYLELNNSDTGNDPSLVCKGSDTNIGLDITMKGSGDMRLNASTGNIYTNSDSLVIGGFIKNSVYRTSSKVGGYIPDTTWNIPINTDMIVFDFVNSSQTGTYWANVSAGIDGQKLNLIFNNRGSNVISVLADFGSNGVIVGTGYSNGLVFETTGQSTALVYLGYGIDAWQVLNTGSAIF